MPPNNTTQKFHQQDFITVHGLKKVVTVNGFCEERVF
jgi:hypothetical protein